MSEHFTVLTKKRHLDNDADEGGPPSSAEITRCEELWFDDGSIVLQAETTQFRVHRSHISMHSPSFKDMFLIPQPEGEARVEGCPVIHVYDRAKDWENLLMAMYNNFKTNAMLKDYPLDRMLSLARLGHKYQFKHFRDIATAYLKAEFPTSLAEWDSCKAHIAYLDSRRYQTDKAVFTAGYEIELINTAIEVGLRSILPVLFFVCMRDCTIGEILRGSKNKDGTVWQLATHVQEALIRAQPELSASATLETVLEPISECTLMQQRCRSPGCRERSKAADCRMMLFHMNPGAALQEPEDLLCCAPCNTSIRESQQRGRHRVWYGLPKDFGLPNWEEAEDLDWEEAEDLDSEEAEDLDSEEAEDLDSEEAEDLA